MKLSLEDQIFSAYFNFSSGRREVVCGHSRQSLQSVALSERCLGRKGGTAGQTINTKGWNIPLLIKIYGGDQTWPGIFTVGKTPQLRLVRDEVIFTLHMFCHDLTRAHMEI